MRVVLFCHSLISDWNHATAHFLRGVARNLQQRGHQLTIYEPEDSKGLASLVARHGWQAIRQFQDAYPDLHSTRYQLRTIALPRVVEHADLVLVDAGNNPELVARLGDIHTHQSRGVLLFCDTHDRGVTDRRDMASHDLRHYDGVLAGGHALRERYVSEGKVTRAWTWHAAADATMFKPALERGIDGEIVWIDNWAEQDSAWRLREFLIGPVTALGLRATVYGVRYPRTALDALARAGIDYRGWLPNFEVPQVLARHSLTVHIPRRPGAASLPGPPTIRPFEAMACGTPLICAPWSGLEGLFTAGEDYRVARNQAEMRWQISELLDRPDLARAMARRARKTLLSRHTCAHRVDELLAIYGEISERRFEAAVPA